MTETGRRERKRQATHDRIAIAARALFAAHGFDGVTVAEVAEAADVSEQTVYNHFPTKEDLVLWRRGTHEARLVEAVRTRAPGESALTAVARHLTAPPTPGAVIDPGAAAGGDPDTAPAGADIDRLLHDSEALRARERSIVATHTAALAALLAAETGAGPDDVEPQVAAAAMLAASQAVIAFARAQVVAGVRPPVLTRAVREHAERAVALLGAGLDGYAVRPGTQP